VGLVIYPPASQECLFTADDSSIPQPPLCDMATRVDNNDAEFKVGDASTDDVNAYNKREGIAADERVPAYSENAYGDPKVNVRGDVEPAWSCDWSQTSVDAAGCDVKLLGEESMQGDEADDELGASSSASEDDWQEVEGLSDCY